MPVTLLGPERPDGQLPRVLAEDGVRGRVALVSAGWRYDEDRDELLRAAIPACEVHNLRLYHRFRELERDHAGLAAAYTQKQDELRKIKDRYRHGITHAIGMARALWDHKPDAHDPWFRRAVGALRELDTFFLAEARRLHEEFEAAAHPERHAAVRAAQEELEEAVDGASALLVAGGHVGILRNRLAFYGFPSWGGNRPIYAWSAGAMVMCERVVLYHDHTAYGPGIAEMLDHGFGLWRGWVVLPHARERLDVNSAENVTILAARLQPWRAVGLQNGAVFGPDGAFRGTPGSAFTMRSDGGLDVEGA
jgi:hypothetical protein